MNKFHCYQTSKGVSIIKQLFGSIDSCLSSLFLDPIRGISMYILLPDLYFTSTKISLIPLLLYLYLVLTKQVDSTFRAF